MAGAAPAPPGGGAPQGARRRGRPGARRPPRRRDGCGPAAPFEGGLSPAHRGMGTAKTVADRIEDEAELVSAYSASKTGTGIDGNLSPRRLRWGSVFDEPRRLDLGTLSRMEGFLGGDFSGV